MNMQIGQLLSMKSDTAFGEINQPGDAATNFFDILLGAQHKMTSTMLQDDTKESIFSIEEALQQFLKEGKGIVENFLPELAFLLSKEVFLSPWNMTDTPFFSELPTEVQQLLLEWLSLSEEEQLDTVVTWLEGSEMAVNSGMLFDMKQHFERAMAATFIITEALSQAKMEESTELLQALENVSKVAEGSSMTIFSPTFFAAIQSLMDPLLGKQSSVTNARTHQEALVHRGEQLLSFLSISEPPEKQIGNMERNANDYLKQVLARHFHTNHPSTSPSTASHIADTGVMSKVEQMTLYLGEAKTEHARAQEFIRQFQQLLGRSSLQSFKNGTTELSIKLHPEHLGRLDIKIVHENGRLHARLITTTQLAKEMVESQLHQLRQAFVQQNIGIERIDVQQSPLSYLQQEGREQKERDETPSKQRKNKNNREESTSIDFEEVLAQLTFNEKV